MGSLEVHFLKPNPRFPLKIPLKKFACGGLPEPGSYYSKNVPGFSAVLIILSKSWQILSGSYYSTCMGGDIITR